MYAANNRKMKKLYRVV